MPWYKCIYGAGGSKGKYNLIQINSNTTTSYLNSDTRFVGKSSYDGSFATTWMPQIVSTEENITYTIGNHKVETITICPATGAAANTVGTLAIYTSADGTNFTKAIEIVDGTFNNAWNAQDAKKTICFLLGGVQATHVRIGIARKSGTAGVAIGVGEISIYGE